MHGLQWLLVQLAELAEAHFSLLTRSCYLLPSVSPAFFFPGRGASWWQSPSRELSVSGLAVYTMNYRGLMEI